MRLLITFLILIPLGASADDLSEHDSKALQDTKSFLKDRSSRDAFIKNDKKAKDVDAKVEALAGSGQTKEEIYGLAAEVLERIVAETKGDPQKMQQLLLEAEQNPQQFYQKYMNDRQKAKVREIATDIEKSGRINQPPR